jgi:hypothetical protein
MLKPKRLEYDVQKLKTKMWCLKPQDQNAISEPNAN